MRSSDKLLLGFVGAMVLLVIAVLLIESNRAQPTYREGTAPEDVVHNYLLALQQSDYERAYAQLSPRLKSYPENLAEFVSDVREVTYVFPATDEEETALTVLSADIKGDFATVQVRESRFYQGGLFGSHRLEETFALDLELMDGVWKIAGGDYYFWSCWSREMCL